MFHEIMRISFRVIIFSQVVCCGCAERPKPIYIPTPQYNKLHSPDKWISKHIYVYINHYIKMDLKLFYYFRMQEVSHDQDFELYKPLGLTSKSY